jgi:hypothetical protein
MAICSSRSESIQSPISLGSWGTRTGIVAWIDVGAGGQESSAEVPNGNDGSLLIGRALDAAGDRSAARAVPMAVNDRANVAAL